MKENTDYLPLRFGCKTLYDEARADMIVECMIDIAGPLVPIFLSQPDIEKTVGIHLQAHPLLFLLGSLCLTYLNITQAMYSTRNLN